VHEVAGKYCPTGRDLFLHRVEHVQPPASERMRQGRLLHELVSKLITEAKQMVYLHGAGCMNYREELLQSPALDSGRLGDGESDTTRANVRTLHAFESRRIMERVEEVLARQSHVGRDALAALALPVNVELKLDGRHLGLSQHLSADAVSFSTNTVLDLKFGPREEFHRLTTTGYALVLESLFEVPFDLGCVIYVHFANGRVLLDRDFHLIDDELRQVFIEERDEKMRSVAEGIDPGMPAQCPSTCSYLTTCYPIQLAQGQGRVVSANPAATMPNGAAALT